MSRPTRPPVGAVVEIALADGSFAYGRVLRDAAIAVYREMSTAPAKPPIGSRDYQFVVGIYDDALADLTLVGQDPSVDSEEDWPPPFSVTDKISGQMSIYHHGEMRPAAESECEGLEPAAVWELSHIVERIERSR
jgi:hypothetical protein